MDGWWGTALHCTALHCMWCFSMFSLISLVEEGTPDGKGCGDQHMVAVSVVEGGRRLLLQSKLQELRALSNVFHSLQAI